MAGRFILAFLCYIFLCLFFFFFFLLLSFHSVLLLLVVIKIVQKIHVKED